MNRQGKVIDGKVVGGIGWTKRRFDGVEVAGYTLNSVTGCKYGCQWAMPNGEIAQCYAKSVAEGVASASYPNGFEEIVYFPERLLQPGRKTKPVGIFLDSMSDLLGPWVKSDHINDVIEMCKKRNNRKHRFFILTKNSPRMLDYIFPPNVAIGVSSPPDYMYFMHGRKLTRHQQEKMLEVSLRNLGEVNGQTFFDPIKWVSFEPLSWDVAPIVAKYATVLDWAVIGAASNGRTYHQPDPVHVQNLLDVLDEAGVRIYFKGNLDWTPRRDELAWKEGWE